jgi:hypothetical protein
MWKVSVGPSGLEAIVRVTAGLRHAAIICRRFAASGRAQRDENLWNCWQGREDGENGSVPVIKMVRWRRVCFSIDKQSLSMPPGAQPRAAVPHAHGASRARHAVPLHWAILQRLSPRPGLKDFYRISSHSSRCGLLPDAPPGLRNCRLVLNGRSGTGTFVTQLFSR